MIMIVIISFNVSSSAIPFLHLGFYEISLNRENKISAVERSTFLESNLDRNKIYFSSFVDLS